MVLTHAVDAFTRSVINLTDADLEKPWVWGDYDEGVRFAFFRVLEELNDLASRLTVERGSLRPVSTAQSLLAHYHTAYRDLEAVLLGVSDDQAGMQPAENEWSVKKALLHMIEAERTFFAITDYAINRVRSQIEMPFELSDADWEEYWVGESYSISADGGLLSELLAYHANLHDRVLTSFVGITQIELGAPVVFWENQPMPVWFRLGRFTSHLRQHTVQIEKTLVALALGPSEAKRLLRLIYQALATIEANLLGDPDLGRDLCLATAGRIVKWTEEITALAA